MLIYMTFAQNHWLLMSGDFREYCLTSMGMFLGRIVHNIQGGFLGWLNIQEEKKSHGTSMRFQFIEPFTSSFGMNSS